MLRTCMHGHTGPLARHHGQGFVLTALSGFDAITSWPDRAPSGVFGALTDFVAPQFNTLCLISALDYRRRTGKGQYIDQSQHEAAMQLIAPLILDYTDRHMLHLTVSTAARVKIAGALLPFLPKTNGILFVR
jgi:benzylsuccinate CoA-transferase BbsF subunit